MRRLVVLTFAFIALCDKAVCESTNKAKRGVIDTFGFYPYQEEKPSELYQSYPSEGIGYYVKELNLEQDATKHAPQVVEHQPSASSQSSPQVPNYANQQFQTVQQHAPQAVRYPAGVNTAQLTYPQQNAFLPGYQNNQQLIGSHPQVNQHVLHQQPLNLNQYVVNQPLSHSAGIAGQHGPDPQPSLASHAAQASLTGGYNRPLSHSPHSPHSPAGLSSDTGKYYQSNVPNVPSAKLLPQSTEPTLQVHMQTAQVQLPPLVYSHVYHPLNTAVKPSQQKTLPLPLHKVISQPQQKPVKQEKVRSRPQVPPTPPRIYYNFRPMATGKIFPVTEALPVTKAPEAPEPEREEQNEEEESEEDKEEINEEGEEEDEKSEDDDDHSSYKKKHNFEYDEFPRHSRYRYRDNDDDDHEHARYRHRHQDDDDDDDHDGYRDTSNRHTDRRPSHSKLSSKYKYPKEHDRFMSYKSKHHEMPQFEHKAAFRPSQEQEFKAPDVEIKMYKYTAKQNKKPQRKERIEGKGSESIPVVHHRKKSYKEQWLISSKSSSLMN